MQTLGCKCTFKVFKLNSVQNQCSLAFEVLEQGMQLIVMPVLIEIVCVVNHKKHVVVSVRHLHFVSAHARLGRLGFFCSFTECTCLALAFYTHC